MVSVKMGNVQKKELVQIIGSFKEWKVMFKCS